MATTAPSLQALNSRFDDWVSGRVPAVDLPAKQQPSSLPYRFELGPKAWLPTNFDDSRPINVQVDPRSNFQTSLRPLDYYRKPDRDFATASRSQPRSVALDTLDFRRFR